MSQVNFARCIWRNSLWMQCLQSSQAHASWRGNDIHLWVTHTKESADLIISLINNWVPVIWEPMSFTWRHCNEPGTYIIDASLLSQCHGYHYSIEIYFFLKSSNLLWMNLFQNGNQKYITIFKKNKKSTTQPARCIWYFPRLTFYHLQYLHLSSWVTCSITSCKWKI